MKHIRGSENKKTIANGILSLTLVLVILQLWLLMATMNAYLAHDLTFVWPAAGASLFCFMLILGLVYYLD